MGVDRITFIHAPAPPAADVNSELQWLAAALGLFGERDKDSSCFRVFITLVKAAQHGEPVSSDDIAGRCGLTRGTVIHHINKLRDTGLVAHQHEGYGLTETSLEASLLKVEEEINDLLKLMRAVARDVDKKLMQY